MDLSNVPAGTYHVDASHSEVGFAVRHLGLSKVRGRFEKFEGTVTVAEDRLASSVTATVEMTSINTNDAQRDGHLRSNDFFAIDEFPQMTFASTGLTSSGGDFELAGDLTIRGVTKPVVFELEFGGVDTDPWGNTRLGFSAETEINRKDFGMEWNTVLESGGLLVGEKVKIHLEVEAVKA